LVSGNPLLAIAGVIPRIGEGVPDPAACRGIPGLDIGKAYHRLGDDRSGGNAIDIFHDSRGATSLAMVESSGHGADAERNATLATYALRAYASIGLDARRCVRALNRLLIENGGFDGGEESFAAVFFALVAPGRRSISYVSAGRDGAVLIAPLGAFSLVATAPVVGLMDNDAAFEHEVIAVRPGDVLVAVTAGFGAEADGRGRNSGADSAVDVIERSGTRSAQRQADALVAGASQFGGRQAHEDVAALVTRILA
jgi:serine phosphatase RsbU (regulator of sigma subunit)